jgi:hypothetical protein
MLRRRMGLIARGVLISAGGAFLQIVGSFGQGGEAKAGGMSTRRPSRSMLALERSFRSMEGSCQRTHSGGERYLRADAQPPSQLALGVDPIMKALE